MTSPRPLRAGFTLIETILVLALLGMLAGGIFGFLWDIVGRRDVLARDAADGQAGSAVVERIEADVMSGLAGGSEAGAGVSGTATSLKLLTRGVDVPTKEARTIGGDLQASEYAFDAGVLRARRWNIGGTAPEFETVCDHVESIRFRFFDGSRWSSSFDSMSTGELPVALEVAIWFGAPHAEPRAESPAPSDAPTPKPAPKPPAEAGDERSGPGTASTAADPAKTPSRRPDRLRVIVVPDGPVAAWKELR